MRKESGYTLIELMVGIAIVSILVGIAVPSWVAWLPSYRLKAATRDLISNFQKAKTEAVRRNGNVILIFDLVNQQYQMYVDEDDGFDNNELMLGTSNIPNYVTLVAANFTGGTQRRVLTAADCLPGLPAVELEQ